MFIAPLEDQRRNDDGGGVDRFLRLRAQGEYPLQHALALLELDLVSSFEVQVWGLRIRYLGQVFGG